MASGLLDRFARYPDMLVWGWVMKGERARVRTVDLLEQGNHLLS
jgi:hypothetical protein